MPEKSSAKRSDYIRPVSVLNTPSASFNSLVGRSSIGRATDSDSVGSRFDPSRPSHFPAAPLKGRSYLPKTTNSLVFPYQSDATTQHCHDTSQQKKSGRLPGFHMCGPEFTNSCCSKCGFPNDQIMVSLVTRTTHQFIVVIRELRYILLE